MPLSDFRHRRTGLAAGIAVACALTWPGAGALGTVHAQGNVAHAVFAAPSTAITSFKAVLDANVSATASSPATTIHATVTVVMPKGTPELSATATVTSGGSGGGPLNIDLVYDGKQLCTRMAAGTPWNCFPVSSLSSSLPGSGSSGAGGLNLGSLLGSLVGGGSSGSSSGSSSSSSMNPLDILGTGASFSYTRIGNGVVEGKPSTGYSYAAKADLGSLSGNIWFEKPDGRLLTMSATGSVKTTPKAKPDTLSLKLTVSNYNDPSLKIPKVKNGQP
jgi:hypothetical protein